MMKVTKTQGTPNRTTTSLELDLTGIPKSKQAQVKEEIGMFLVERVLKSVAASKSPVDGEDWPTLDPEYKKQKVAESLPGKPNLEASGKMLDSLTFKTTRNGVEIGFFNKQAWKADGHLKFSGEENNIPQRRFLPGEGQSFKDEINTQVERIISDARVTDDTLEGLGSIDTKEGLYSFLSEQLGLETRSEIRQAVIRNQKLFDQLEELDLVELL